MTSAYRSSTEYGPSSGVEVAIATTCWASTSSALRGTTVGSIAHADAAGPGATVQIGMDTPQVTAADLVAVQEAAAEGAAVLGPAADGGWWVLALSDAAQLVDVDDVEDADAVARLGDTHFARAWQKVAP